MGNKFFESVENDKQDLMKGVLGLAPEGYSQMDLEFNDPMMIYFYKREVLADGYILTGNPLKKLNLVMPSWCGPF